MGTQLSPQQRHTPHGYPSTNKKTPLIWPQVIHSISWGLLLKHKSQLVGIENWKVKMLTEEKKIAFSLTEENKSNDS